MKKIFTILSVLLISLQLVNAQNSSELNSFKVNVLPKYSSYFSQASMTDNGQLELSALEKYIVLSTDSKNTIMADICTAWQNSFIIVSYGSKRELWGRNPENGSTRQMDCWDLNASRLSQIPVTTSTFHPWFFYIGGQLGYDTQKNVSMSLSTRLGFYLLLNRWDMAATFATGLAGPVEGDPSYWSNVGLMSRVHFPIRKIGINPNIGGEITYTPFGGGAGTFSGAVLAGIGWYVGVGSLDFGVSIGNQVTGMVGFTFVPKLKGKKLE